MREKMTADFQSPYYPYHKVQTGFNSMRGAEEIPYQIVTYLMDLKDQNGYIPQDDNTRPRVRLMKYLWYDGENPLSNILPSDEEKLSLLFDGNHPVLNTDEEKQAHPKGYRIYPQIYWLQSELEAKTILKCYIGRLIPVSPFEVSIGLTFEFLVNYALDNVTKTTAYSKIFAMEQCVVEALNGVNITGIGVVNFSRTSHADAGSRAYHDNGTHIYRILNMSIDWAESCSM